MLLRRNLVDLIHNHLVSYPTPANINYWWGMGSIAGILLGCQLVTGILLAMHYAPTVDLAFGSLEHIMRDVNYGWFLRYLHANGASFFFFFVYLHLGRSFVYGLYTYPRRFLWFSGLVIFFLMMAIAFMGYVLPWGQMSFWGATVITNLFTVIPFAGEDVAYWLWGGFSVGNATLTRFFSFHFTLPFILVAVVFVHLAVLHQAGSSSVFGVVKHTDKIFFYPYFYVKDYVGVLGVGLAFLGIVTYQPDMLGHPDNYILANPLVTPTHIVPEWYFLPYYALLRSIPNKLAGVVVMGLSICVCLVLPFYSVTLRSVFYQGRLFYRWFVWSFLSIFVILGFLGGQPIELPYSIFAQIFAFCYFIFFFAIVWVDYIYANYLFFWSSTMKATTFGFFLSFLYLTGPNFRRRRKQIVDPAVGRLFRIRISLGRRTFKNMLFRFKKRMHPARTNEIRRTRVRFTFFKGLIAQKMQNRLKFLVVFRLKSLSTLAGWTWTYQKLNLLLRTIDVRRNVAARQRYVKSAIIQAREYRHPFHLVTTSPWPFSISFSLSLALLGVVAFFHRFLSSDTLMQLGLFFMLYVMFRWFVDITREGTFEGNHLDKVQFGLKSGMLLFITSEVLFFFAFFWGFFHASLAPAIQIGGVWPPLGIAVFNPWDIPLLNTLILLTSGAAVTWAHFGIRTSAKTMLRDLYEWDPRAMLWVRQGQQLFLLSKLLRFKQFKHKSVRYTFFEVKDKLRIYPMRRVRFITHFNFFLSLYRVWMLKTFCGIVVAKRRSTQWLILALRRHLVEFSASMTLFFAQFVMPVLAAKERFFEDFFYFRLRRRLYFLKRIRYRYSRRLRWAYQRRRRNRFFGVTQAMLSAARRRRRKQRRLERKAERRSFAISYVKGRRFRWLSRRNRLQPLFTSPFVHILKQFMEFNAYFLYAFALKIMRFRLFRPRITRSRQEVIYGFLLTISLGILFTIIQYYEYLHAPFNISDSVYGTTFFVTTGFHGLHVIVGTLLLLVSLRRMITYHFTNAHHVGMEAAIWYWHFVDVVWLGLYISIYHWGGQF
jgi:quinol-cytochrome oxidoreductase complex cytochrome b subunit/heme/copper-type cytochrome/quinol oxidase subunit 3